MIEKSKYWSEVIKKHFNKVLLTTKEDNEGCKNSNKCYNCDNDYVDDDVKVIIVISLGNVQALHIYYQS